MMRPVTFYVMQEVDGDECLLFHARIFEEAQQKLLSYLSGHTAIPAEQLSIWNSQGGMVAWLHQGQWISKTARAPAKFLRMNRRSNKSSVRS